jgi:flagellin-like hook-associated protein FlgL
LAGTFVRYDSTSTAAAGAGAVADIPPTANAITYVPGTNDLTTVDLTTLGNGGFTTSHYTTHASGSFLESEPVGQGDLESQHRKAVSKGYYVAISPIATGEDSGATEILAGSTISTLQDLGSPNGLGVATSEGGVDLNTVDGAKSALTKIVDALSQLHLDRAGLGAIQSRIEFTNGQLMTSKQNLSQAKSRITDVDVASESTEYARQQILVQSGTQMLREANRLPQTALELLR